MYKVHQSEIENNPWGLAAHDWKVRDPAAEDCRDSADRETVRVFPPQPQFHAGLIGCNWWDNLFVAPPFRFGLTILYRAAGL
jgi:hypothetical protein